MSGPQSIKRLADRYRDVVGRLGARADELTARVDHADVVGHEAFDRHSTALDLIEHGIREIEDLTNQLSNGGPPLEASMPPKTPPGVTLHSPVAVAGNGVKTT